MNTSDESLTVLNLDDAITDLKTVGAGFSDISIDRIKRHLGLPISAQLDDDLARQVDECRDRFLAEADVGVWIEQKRCEGFAPEATTLCGDVKLTSPLLAEGFRRTNVETLLIVGITAGRRVEQMLETGWKEERPDEAMTLNAIAIAWVEGCRQKIGERLGELLADQAVVLPHYSPGYTGWDLADQKVLFDVLSIEKERLELLPSLMLDPPKSTLAVYGLASASTDIGERELFWDSISVGDEEKAKSAPDYGFTKRALKKWVQNRLTLTAVTPDEMVAQFRVDGTTCANMGVPLALDYEVELSRSDSSTGFVIDECLCRPAPGDSGHASTCLYLSSAAAFTSVTKEMPSIKGKPLDEVLTWEPDVSPAGCLCARPSRNHKWKVVLSTVHFALNQE